ncbi:MAG TPA: hypothetical protein VIF62_07945 [Labilithrix sp.]|jgi:hypothetical protein
MRRFVSFFLVLIAACGGSQPEAKTPTTDSADVVRDGSSAPDPSVAAASLPPTETPKAEPVKTSAVSNTADGSDIVPPFTASSPDQDKKATPKASKKKKSKKKT